LGGQGGPAAGGRRIAAGGGGRGAKVLRENGGADGVVGDSGLDPRWVAEQVALGAFTNTGQICTSVERVYLPDGVADAVLAELVTVAEGLVVGNPADPATTPGPLVDRD